VLCATTARALGFSTGRRKNLNTPENPPPTNPLPTQARRRFTLACAEMNAGSANIRFDLIRPGCDGHHTVASRFERQRV
jgi:hypothetical protein